MVFPASDQEHRGPGVEVEEGSQGLLAEPEEHKKCLVDR